jgi:hypothetical protein
MTGIGSSVGEGHDTGRAGRCITLLFNSHPINARLHNSYKLLVTTSSIFEYGYTHTHCTQKRNLDGLCGMHD